MTATLPPGGSVFLVEDEVMIRMMVVDMLEELGYRVAAEVGEISEAIRLVQSTEFDLAILDVNIKGTMITPVSGLQAVHCWIRVLGRRHLRARRSPHDRTGRASRIWNQAEWSASGLPVYLEDMVITDHAKKGVLDQRTHGGVLFIGDQEIEPQRIDVRHSARGL